MLDQKKIVLGITGGIAAYKCAHLVRLLVKEGCEIKVVLTPAASQFVTPQTLSVLSKNEVLSDFFDSNQKWNNHVALAEWADVLLIAPLTANSLAKMATGICDSLLLSVYLSAKTKTIVAPAMDLDMYKHPSVLTNLQTLTSFGNKLIPAESGELASGLIGEGRMAEPETIVSFLRSHFSEGLPLSGKTALVNAGPTFEAIDPVRFIGNRSTGKMGMAIAEELSKQGAFVTLVLGPSALEIRNKSIQVIPVETSDQMYEHTLANFENKDIVICTAAVADYKPTVVSENKIKKKEGSLNLQLIRTKDILLELGRLKKSQCLVGFALETNKVLDYAKQKLSKKNLDIIIANSAVEPGSGFGHDTNKITILDKHNKTVSFELKSKQEVAKDIVSYIINFTK